MPYVSLNARYGTWYRSDEPGVVKYNKTSYLAARSTGPVMHSYVYFSAPFNIPGAVVSEAKLYLYLQGGTTNTGTRTISVQRVAKGLNFTRMTYTNRPTAFVGSTSSVQTTGPLSANHQFEIDVTADLQNVANGGTFYGYIITTTAPFTMQLHGARTARPPALFVRYSYPPSAPRDLSPSMGRGVAVTKPTLGFGYNDIAGEEKVSAVRVQTASSSTGFGSPAWDSGTVTTSTPGLDLSGTSFPARTSGQVTWWRAQARSAAGVWSPWSLPVSWTHRPHVTVNVTAPTGTTADPTPPITWTATGQTAYEVQWWEVVAANNWRLLQSSGVRTGTEQTWTPTVGASTPGRQHVARVFVRDSIAREATPGDTGMAQGQQYVTFQPTASVAPATGFQASAGYPRPEVWLSWYRTQVPDQWNVYMDGRRVASLPGADARIMDTTGYELKLRSAGGTHSWSVRAVVNRQVSEAATAAADAGMLGTWLFDDDGRAVCIQGDREHPMKFGEVSAVHEPLGSDRVVVITQALRGLEGSLSGLLTGLKGQLESASLWRRNLLDFKSRAGETFTMVIEDMEIPVTLREVNVVGDPDRPGSWLASFEFYQQGDLPFYPLGAP